MWILNEILIKCDLCSGLLQNVFEMGVSLSHTSYLFTSRLYNPFGSHLHLVAYTVLVVKMPFYPNFQLYLLNNVFPSFLHT